MGYEYKDQLKSIDTKLNTLLERTRSIETIAKNLERIADALEESNQLKRDFKYK